MWPDFTVSRYIDHRSELDVDPRIANGLLALAADNETAAGYISYCWCRGYFI